MASYDYDVIVIGGGASGIVCARLLAKAGKSVALIEKSRLGGASLMHSHIPLQAMLESAHIYHKARQSEKMGLRGSTIGFNYPSVRAWKNSVVKNTAIDEAESSLEQDSVQIIKGSAHFIGPHTVTVGRARYSAKKFVIATGSEIAVPSVPGLVREDFLTYRDALELSRPPKSLAIVGGGVMGAEFASLFGSFGSKVYLIEKASHLLPKEDSIVGKTLAQNLEDQYDANVLTRAGVQSCAKRASKKQLVLKVAGHLHTIVVDEVLMATGTHPATDLGLENSGVKYSKAGIAVNSNLQTSAKHIWAVGDVTGGHQLPHTSIYEARVAAHNITHAKQHLADYSTVTRVVYSYPEVACVGLSSNELKNFKIKTTSAIVDINVVAKSHSQLPIKGFVKVVADRKTHQLVSAQIVAPGASEMIHELTLAIKNGLTAHEVATTLHAFPTWSEAIGVACTKLAKKL